MTRLESWSRESLTGDGQRAVWDSVVGSRGRRRMVNAQGGLAGPFNAWLRSPAVGGRFADLGAVLRSEWNLHQQYFELITLIVASRHHAEYLWWGHSQLAVEKGLSHEVVGAIGRGDEPDLAEADRRFYDLVTAILDGGHLTEDRYREAIDDVGEVGLVKVVGLCGFYVSLALTLNVFDVPLPSDVNRFWP